MLLWALPPIGCVSDDFTFLTWEPVQLTLCKGNFIVVEITPIGIRNLGWQFYIIWTVFNGAFVPLVYLFYPETAGRTLEDIDRYFMEHSNILVFRDKVC